jgi:hypothetical protein
MKKNFGDIKVGDSVWQGDQKEWKIIQQKVIKVEPVKNCVPEYLRISLSNGVIITVRPSTWGYVEDNCRYWTDKEKAIESMNELANRMEQVYINKIDELVSKYDNLLKWKRSISVT